jgi:probable selenium-dependent hydroxylase accessory protein YqeC
MPRLTDIIDFQRGEAVAIVGSGGKTSLMWLLAAAHAQEQNKVLVTTTTKIRRPAADQYQELRSSESLPVLPFGPGIVLAGDEAPGGKGKLGPLKPGVLEAALPYFDYTFLEGDGSRNLPLKGWAGHEPVAPEFITCTIGVVTLWPVGHKVSEEIVHRLPLFCEISGAREGEALSLEHVAAAVAHPRGLMKGSRGRRILYINQVEDWRDKDRALELLSLLPPAFLETLSLVASGSVRRDEGHILWRRP